MMQQMDELKAKNSQALHSVNNDQRLLNKKDDAMMSMQEGNKKAQQVKAGTSLVPELIHDGLIQVPLGSRAQCQGHGQQGVHLLILLQDLVVLRGARVVLLDPASRCSQLSGTVKS